MASGWGKLLVAVVVVVPAEGEVRLVIQFLTMTGRKPWKLAAPVTSMMVLSLGKLGLRSRWMMEVRDLRAAALISIRWSPFISSSSTSSSSRPEYSRPCTVYQIVGMHQFSDFTRYQAKMKVEYRFRYQISG